MSTDLFVSIAQDANGDKGNCRMFVSSAVFDAAARTAFLDAVAGLSDMQVTEGHYQSIINYTDGAAVAPSGSNYADNKFKLETTWATANPRERVKFSIPGPTTGLPVGNDGKIDPATNNALITALRDAVIGKVCSNSGALVTSLLKVEITKGR